METDTARAETTNSLERKSFEQISFARFALDWGASAAMIVLMTLLTERVSSYFLPFAIIINAVCFYRIGVLGHEGLHNLISRNRALNNLFGRYLCHFVVLTSHSRYKNIHMLHHRFTALENDPDAYLYSGHPAPWKPWLRKNAVDFFTFKLAADFLGYFTDIPDAWRKYVRGQKTARFVFVKSDFPQFIAYWLSLFVLFQLTGSWRIFLLYWFVPVLLTIPLIRLSNVLQHGGFSEKGQTRTLVGHWWIIGWLLPVNLNYHYEHHLNPRVPYFNLKAYSEFLKTEGDPLQAESHHDIPHAARTLFLSE